MREERWNLIEGRIAYLIMTQLRDSVGVIAEAEDFYVASCLGGASFLQLTLSFRLSIINHFFTLSLSLSWNPWCRLIRSLASLLELTVRLVTRHI